MGVLTRGRKDDVEQRIRSVLEGLRPMLHLGECALTLVSFDRTTGVTTLRIQGDCPDCDMSAETLLSGIETHVKLRVPEVRVVRTAPAAGTDGDG
jgi:Fe-S cluster biogenesis protein NfuA